MGRLIFVTVGTSAIGNPELWKDPRALPACLPREGHWDAIIRKEEEACLKAQDEAGEPVNWDAVEEIVRNHRSRFEDQLTDLHRKFWNNPNDHHRRKNSRHTSAEAISTWLAIKSGLIGGDLTSEDQVVLLASRTCVGQMAARINEKIFREFLFPNGAGTITVEPLSELRLAGILDEGEGEMSLSARMREIYENHIDNNPRTPLFNITGGFKGVIPILTMLCADRNVRMMYLHDSMRSVVFLDFIDRDLREQYEPVHIPEE